MQGLQGLTGYRAGRRGVVMGGLMTGFTLAATRGAAAQVIHTDTAGIDATETKIPVGDTDLPAYVAHPHGNGPFPTVLVIEEIFGVHEHIKDLCRRLAKAGYYAIAPELYARLADLSKMTDIRQIVTTVILKAPDDRKWEDLDRVAAHAAQHGGDASRLAVTGFCRGGRDAWLYAAHSPDLKAAVAWYGPVEGDRSDIQPRTPVDVAAALKCPLLGLYGAKDDGIPAATVQAAAEKAKTAGKTVELVIYPDAGHGFNADYRPSYNATDAKDGWARMLAWFKKYGVA